MISNLPRLTSFILVSQVEKPSKKRFSQRPPMQAKVTSVTWAFFKPLATMKEQRAFLEKKPERIGLSKKNFIFKRLKRGIHQKYLCF